MTRKLEGVKVDNGENCQGLMYLSSDGKVEMTVFTMRNRYPSADHSWAMNIRSLGVMAITEGTGRLLQKDEPPIDFEAGDTLEITPGDRYAYQGDFTAVTTWNPPFDKDQYREEKD